MSEEKRHTVIERSTLRDKETCKGREGKRNKK